MPDPVNRDTYGYNENLAEANNAEFGPAGAEIIIPSLAGGIAANAADPEDALRMCRHVAAAEELSDEQFLALVREVANITEWEIPGMGERF